MSSRPNVMLIDSDNVLSDTLGRLLEKCGYTVIVASEAQQAVNLADANMPSLVITELLLREHNGLEFIYEFRSYPEWQDVPIIVMSRISEAESGITEYIRQTLSIVSYIYKPDFSRHKFLREVKKYVRIT